MAILFVANIKHNIFMSPTLEFKNKTKKNKLMNIFPKTQDRDRYIFFSRPDMSERKRPRSAGGAATMNGCSSSMNDVKQDFFHSWQYHKHSR